MVKISGTYSGANCDRKAYEMVRPDIAVVVEIGIPRVGPTTLQCRQLSSVPHWNCKVTRVRSRSRVTEKLYSNNIDESPQKWSAVGKRTWYHGSMN